MSKGGQHEHREQYPRLILVAARIAVLFSRSTVAGSPLRIPPIPENPRIPRESLKVHTGVPTVRCTLYTVPVPWDPPGAPEGGAVTPGPTHTSPHTAIHIPVYLHT